AHANGPSGRMNKTNPKEKPAASPVLVSNGKGGKKGPGCGRGGGNARGGFATPPTRPAFHHVNTRSETLCRGRRNCTFDSAPRNSMASGAPCAWSLEELSICSYCWGVGFCGDPSFCHLAKALL